MSTWDFGHGSSGTSSGTTGITHYYAAPGNYVICLTVTNFLGTCTSTYCDSLTIGMGSTGACLGYVNSTFTATDSLGYGIFTNAVMGTSPVYYWDFGDGSNSSVVGSTNHYYSAPGTYLVCLTVYETAGTADSCQYCSYVTISSPPAACSAYFVVQQDTANIYNYFVYNYGSVAGGTISYLWDFGDGTTSTLAYPSHTYTTTSTVILCLTVSDGLGCTSTYCDSITPGLAMSSPFTVTMLPPGTAGITQACIATSMKNYPNPFSENTTIEYSISKDANVSVMITDLLGNTVAELENGSKAAGSYSINWNAEGTAEGMYLLQLKVNNTVSTSKIVINR
jgi:PKD repeat protein